MNNPKFFCQHLLSARLSLAAPAAIQDGQPDRRGKRRSQAECNLGNLRSPGKAKELIKY